MTCSEELSTHRLQKCSHLVAFVCSIQVNSVYSVQPKITNYKFASEGVNICTHATSLTFDLTSDQEKLPEKKYTIHTSCIGENTWSSSIHPHKEVDVGYLDKGKAWMNLCPLLLCVHWHCTCTSSVTASSGPSRPQPVRGSDVGARGGGRPESHSGAALVLGSGESKGAGPAQGAAGHGPPQGPAAPPRSGSVRSVTNKSKILSSCIWKQHFKC